MSEQQENVCQFFTSDNRHCQSTEVNNYTDFNGNLIKLCAEHACYAIYKIWKGKNSSFYKD